MDRESRIKKGEIREHTGVAIVNPYGGLWGNEIFDTPEKALAFFKKQYPEGDKSRFRLATAIQTTELYRDLGEPHFVPFPDSQL